ncbi:zinc ribbon domain-containing protein [Methanolapillus ohkumae]|uniref:Zinc-ribbon domain-containing protein n=1 Tax=Methanolapillus ohkumae TaxID=3028298 RepID=A0AA96ZVY4_9EURY|nr:hypothetical protein MsAm2_11900 [Methanosarcinaceae archaeon Am2]
MTYNYCPNCGNKIEKSDAVICTNCGIPLKKTPYGVPPQPPKSDEPAASTTAPPAADAELVYEPQTSGSSVSSGSSDTQSESKNTESTTGSNTSSQNKNQNKGQNQNQKPAGEKIPFLSLILSFFWPGLGQVYNGQFWRGMAFAIAVPIGYCFLIFPGLAIQIYGLYDAYTQAEKMNKGEIPFAEAKLWEVLVFILFPILVAAIVVLAFFMFMIPVGMMMTTF